MITQEIKSCPACGNPFKCWQNDINFCFCKNVTLNKRQQEELAGIYTDCLCPDCLSKVADRYKKSRQKGSDVLYRYPVTLFDEAENKITTSFMIPEQNAPYPLVLLLHQSGTSKFEWFERNNPVLGGNISELLLKLGFAVIAPEQNDPENEMIYSDKGRMEIIRSVVRHCLDWELIDKNHLAIVAAGDAVKFINQCQEEFSPFEFIMACSPSETFQAGPSSPALVLTDSDEIASNEFDLLKTDFESSPKLMASINQWLSDNCSLVD